MKHGDFTKLAKDYKYRPNYSLEVLRVIGTYAGMDRPDFRIAEVGAGTGKLTENLVELGLKGDAVEPNDAMRAEGIKLFENNDAFTWRKGFAEDNGLPSDNYDWALMGSSFHWAETEPALKEFHRVLKPGGLFTAIYVTRDIEGHKIHEDIEGIVNKNLPDMHRVSSANKSHHMDVGGKLLSTEMFDNLFFVEAPHTITMSVDRYMGIWRSVNDIQVQAGEELFKKILDEIQDYLKDFDEITVPYLSRAWTVRVVK